MEPSKAIAFVRRYNAWRRCDEDSEQPHPREIGIALDSLCDHAERLERELEQLKATLADPAEVELAMIRGDIAIPDRVEFDGIRETKNQPETDDDQARDPA